MEKLALERTARVANHPIDRIFLDRWSPRAMAGEGISREELFTLFEAARWAPSSFNVQPWRFLYAHRDTSAWPLFLDLLVEKNRLWAHKAAVLLVIASDPISKRNGKRIGTHAFCTGAAWMSLALQGSMRGLVVHGMSGFDRDAAKTNLRLPETWEVHAMAAIGRRGTLEDLDPEFHASEKPSVRNAVEDFVFEGPFRREGAV